MRTKNEQSSLLLVKSVKASLTGYRLSEVGFLLRKYLANQTLSKNLEKQEAYL